MVIIRNPRKPVLGFTLVELLVVIVIVAALASLIFTLAGRGMMKAQQTQALQQMRDISVGIEAFSVDYNRPPIPLAMLSEGEDTVYGAPDGDFGSEVVIGAITGSDTKFSKEPEGIAAGRKLNLRDETYIQPVLVDDRRGGVDRKDGKLYDVWGREIMIAVNAPPFEEEFNQGKKDKVLFTQGLGEWNDKKPRYQSYVLWSYGKDGVKSPSYAKSDDVANF